MSASVDSVLRQSIAERRLISFRYGDYERICEPHDYGELEGGARLVAYQVGGGSRSGKLPEWRTFVVDLIQQAAVLDERFPGPRQVAGKHVAWTRLFASVSRKV